MNTQPIYSQLTNVNNEQSTDNFFQSLPFRENGYRLISILNNIEDFSIIEGFLHNELSESEKINTFKRCVIEVKKTKAKSILELLSDHKDIEKVVLFSKTQIEIILK